MSPSLQIQADSVDWSSNVLGGSGILAGIFGRAAEEMDRLGLWWVNDLASITMEMDYLSFPDPSDITVVGYSQLDADNSSSDTVLTATIERSATEENSTQHSEEWSETLGVSVSVTASLFKVVETSASIEFSATHTSSSSNSHTESQTLTWTGSLEVPPREQYIIDLIYYKGLFNIRYNAKVVFRCKSGVTLSWTKPGNCTGVAAGVSKIKPKKIPRGRSLKDQHVPVGRAVIL